MAIKLHIDLVCPAAHAATAFLSAKGMDFSLMCVRSSWWWRSTVCFKLFEGWNVVLAFCYSTPFVVIFSVY